jgi:hypothetical protein
MKASTITPWGARFDSGDAGGYMSKPPEGVKAACQCPSISTDSKIASVRGLSSTVCGACTVGV